MKPGPRCAEVPEFESQMAAYQGMDVPWYAGDNSLFGMH
jgi:hypothetical protein